MPLSQVLHPLQPHTDQGLTHTHATVLVRPAAASGVPASTAAATLTATYNDLESVQALFEANQGEIAGVILEPVVGNSGFIVPTQEFLQGLRDLCTANGALLCFDEVMTGFRIARGCAQVGCWRASSPVVQPQETPVTVHISSITCHRPHTVMNLE